MAGVRCQLKFPRGNSITFFAVSLQTAKGSDAKLYSGHATSLTRMP